MNRVYRRPQSNPNRWMINYVPVMPPKPKIDWLSVTGFVVVIGAALWFALALRTI